MKGSNTTPEPDEVESRLTESLVAWVEVQCPYCFEWSEIAIEADVRGAFVQDCEVCCRPWELTVRRDAAGAVQLEMGSL